MASRKKKKAVTGENGEQEFEMVTDESDGRDEFFSASEANDSEGRPKPQRINMYCKHTHYDVVRESGKMHMEFHLSKREKSDWDIAWFDGPISIKLLKEMNFN